jgi:hypothetical protein
MGFLLCSTKFYKNGDPEKKEPGPRQHKNHKYPFKFLRSFLGEVCCSTGTEQRVEGIIWRIFLRKGFSGFFINILARFTS